MVPSERLDKGPVFGPIIPFVEFALAPGKKAPVKKTSVKSAAVKKPVAKDVEEARALDAELALIRAQGFARDNEEREENLHCIGAPIFDHTGFVVATLSVSWPGFRYERGDEADKIEMVKAAAGRISTILGYEP